MFAQHNIQIPATFEEFMAICAVFNSRGITPTWVGGAQIWPVYMPYIMLYHRMHGDHLYQEVILNHQPRFDDPAFIQTGVVLQDMIRANVFNQNVNATNMEEARANFGTGRFPMFFDGVWNLPRYIHALGDDLGFFDFPVMPGGRGLATDQLINWDEGYAISVGARNQPAAEAFLEFIFSPERQTTLANYGSLITTFNPPTNPNLPRIVIDVSNALDNATNAYIPWDNPLGAGFGMIFNQAIQRLFALEDPVRVFQDLNRAAIFEWN
jgi:raffinose/stachyose/melibiose transport system substrate-binding protein